MYIEFDIPNGTIVTAISVDALHNELYNWSAHNGIVIAEQYRVKGRSKYRVELWGERDYQQFALSWNPAGDAWMRVYRIVRAENPSSPNRVTH